MGKITSAILGFFELIALVVALSIWLQYYAQGAGAAAGILCVILVFTILTGMGLPRFKHRGKAFIAFIFSAFMGLVALGTYDNEVKAKLAELKGTDQVAYLELLKTVDEDKWLTELSRINPDRYSEVTTARREKAQAEALQKRKDECTSGKEGYAYVMMQDVVKQRLKAPSTAKFPVLQGKGTRHLGDCVYQVAGTFDAQNGFGAMIRGSFHGKIVYDPSDETWLPISLEVDG